jgi:nitroreductase
MSLDLSVDQVLSTTRSVRKRLDLDQPVPREAVLECLELALQAPTGGNSQEWRWLFVEDADKKRAIAEVYRTQQKSLLTRNFARHGDIRDRQMDAMLESARYLNEHLHEVPVLLIPCVAGRPETGSVNGSAGFWGSLLPAVWSFMLALRSRGLGSAWTSAHLIGDGERHVADILGIPADDYAQGGLFPIAYTKGTDFKKAVRVPADEVMSWDSWRW